MGGRPSGKEARTADLRPAHPDAPLAVRLLGEIALYRGDRRLALPQSKKTRALLAYLVATGKPQRRERLCALLWDVTDDPRAALRWSLTKLRPLVDDAEGERLVADRNQVEIRTKDLGVDLLDAKRALARGADTLDDEALADLAASFHGEFLHGLDLPDFHDFQSWVVAMREEVRRLHVQILDALIDRLADRPADALSHARTLVQADPLSEAARARLVALLVALGRVQEAREQVEIGERVLGELGAPSTGALRRALAADGASSVSRRLPPALEPIAPPAIGWSETIRLAGRRSEMEQLREALRQTTAERRARVVLLSGEPGVGKTRLSEELASLARTAGATLFDGCSYEAEGERPYGPWMDALARLHPTSVGESLGADLGPLLSDRSAAQNEGATRERLFGAVVDLLAARAHSAALVVVRFDDVQWIDEASTELLHYAVRMNRHRPLLFVLAARSGEMLDNAPLCRCLRAWRREQILAEIALEPLGREDTAELIRSLSSDVDADRVWAETAGNPLFAIERVRAGDLTDAVPLGLRDLVRDRIARLPAAHGEVLRWAAVLGQSIDVGLLEQLVGTDAEALLAGLESLQRHGVLRDARDGRKPGASWVFAHDVVRQVVSADLSDPRRRAMHARVARVLSQGGVIDEELAAEIARHASIAGETDLAASACVLAARRCLRLFANVQAENLARRGLRYAEDLAEPERLMRRVELTEVQVAARLPAKLDETARAIEELGELALDHHCVEHARRAFHLASHLRWHGGAASDAQRQSLRAEMVSRTAGEREQVVAMAEAARCLCLLERDLDRAARMVDEANLRSARLGVEPSAIAHASGMLRLHDGRLDDAAVQFTRARDLARQEGDHLAEFLALENLVMLELQRRRIDAARRVSDELLALAGRLREGSEAPFARALAALTKLAAGEDARVLLEGSLDELRVADAKQRLAYSLTRAAWLDLEAGNAAMARERATEALRSARAVGRPTETTLARVVLARAAAALGDAAEYRCQIDELRAQTLDTVAAPVREEVRSLLPSATVAPTGPDTFAEES